MTLAGATTQKYALVPEPETYWGLTTLRQTQPASPVPDPLTQAPPRPQAYGTLPGRQSRPLPPALPLAERPGAAPARARLTALEAEWPLRLSVKPLSRKGSSPRSWAVSSRCVCVTEHVPGAHWLRGVRRAGQDGGGRARLRLGAGRRERDGAEREPSGRCVVGGRRPGWPVRRVPSGAGRARESIPDGQRRGEKVRGRAQARGAGGGVGVGGRARSRGWGRGRRESPLPPPGPRDSPGPAPRRGAARRQGRRQARSACERSAAGGDPAATRGGPRGQPGLASRALSPIPGRGSGQAVPHGEARSAGCHRAELILPWNQFLVGLARLLRGPQCLGATVFLISC